MTILKKAKMAWEALRSFKKAKKEAKVTKKNLESMTVWGLIIMALSTLKEHFGWTITESQIETAITFIVWIVGLVTAYFGRKRADKPLQGVI
ncbi:MAG: hypothetical protein C4519_00385 [Desulfobacteraceae bacterium]|nr:MAG: hypothetical protein C4519_00385 [Desulfobacteraceae bacterium]